ncbi:MAG: CHASE2 domain-containing protein [Oligoflexia bacterium]|nr:CHASE2 domain-containing protein [Oligoflexia bacterium]
MKALFEKYFKNTLKESSGELNQYYPLVFTFIFILILIQYSFPSIEAFLYDLRIRSDFAIEYNNDVIVITLDDESDAFLGEKYPYTYATHTRFFSELTKARPGVISFLVGLQNPDSDQESIELEKLKSIIQKYTNNGGSFRFGTHLLEGFGEQWPPGPLQELGHSLTLIHIDSMSFAKDEICRRAILNISGDDSIHLWSANQFRSFKGLPTLSATSFKGAYYSHGADATFAFFRYFTNPVSVKEKGNIPKIPYHKVAVGNFPSDYFKDKVVIIASQYSSRDNDFIQTPFNREKDEFSVPTANIHATITQALIQNKTVVEIPRYFTNILCFIIAILLSYINSRTSPMKGLLIILITMVAILAISFALFSLFGAWLYTTHLVFTVFIAYYIWVPFRAIAEYQTRYVIEEESKLLKEVDELKQNFISLMSHDLKTPVAKIAGNAENLYRIYAQDEKQKAHLQNIMDATKELNHFITGILDFIKIESRRLKLNLISKDINTIVEEVAKNYRYEAANQSITIEQSLAPLYPISIDPDLMKRVISNLLENAIKYAGKESKIIVKTWDDERLVYVEVRDNGVGIASENLEHIFDKFYRVKNDASHGVKGFGLGLYLVKYFVELNNGSISVESELGKGTAFLIKLKNA